MTTKLWRARCPHGCDWTSPAYHDPERAAADAREHAFAVVLDQVTPVRERISGLDFTVHETRLTEADQETTR